MVQVLYFAAVRELLGVSEENVPWAKEDGSVEQFAEKLVSHHPELKEHLSGVRFAVNEEFVALSAKVRAGDVVALIPPVSGG